MLPAANVRGPHHVRSIEWRLRRLVPAAAVTTHAKPHAQQQYARDLEVERAAMGQRCRPQSFGEAAQSFGEAARQSAATPMAEFLVNCSCAAVQLQKKQSQSLRLACPEIERWFGY